MKRVAATPIQAIWRSQWHEVLAVASAYYFPQCGNDSDIGCWVTINCGQEEDGLGGAPDQVHIAVSPERATPSFLRGLLEQTVLFWRPADAFLDQSRVSTLLNQPVGEAKVGWLTHLASQDVKQALPNDFVGEAFVEGILIQGSEGPGNADDAVYMNRVIRLCDALRPRGFPDMRHHVPAPLPSTTAG